jgi:hypothetical protein
VSTVQQDKDTLQGQLNVLEEKNKEYSQQLEDKLCVNKVDNSNQTTTSGTEEVTMAGELEKPEDILRQRIIIIISLNKCICSHPNPPLLDNWISNSNTDIQYALTYTSNMHPFHDSSKN